MRRLAAALIASGLAGSPALAGAELLLVDGQVLEGRAVERKRNLYFLELESEDVLPIPVSLVRQVRLTGDDAPAPDGIEKTEPKTLAGNPQAAELPRPAEQLAVLGDRQRHGFQQGIFDPYWRPSSDWDLNPALNNFNPARWYEAPIDPYWTPRSAFTAADDVTQFNPARWYRAPIDSTWWPTDGFAKPRP